MGAVPAPSVSPGPAKAEFRVTFGLSRDLKIRLILIEFVGDRIYIAQTVSCTSAWASRMHRAEGASRDPCLALRNSSCSCMPPLHNLIQQVFRAGIKTTMAGEIIGAWCALQRC